MIPPTLLIFVVLSKLPISIVPPNLTNLPDIAVMATRTSTNIFGLNISLLGN